MKLDRKGRLRDKGVKALAKSLKENKSITSIDLSGNGIRSAGVIEIAEALKENQSITSIDLSSSRILPSGVIALAATLKKNKSITSINLSENHITNSGVIALAEALKENQSITSIKLKDMLISSEGTIVLAEALKENKSITSIDLSGNLFRDEGTIAIAEALKENQSITSINLSENQIRNEGARAIAEALKENKSITSVNLAKIEFIMPEVLIALVEALQENKSITSVNLAKMQLFVREQLIAIARALESQSITSIDLSGNRIGDAEAKAIAEALKENKSITSIDLSGNRIGTEGAIAIAEALKENQSITSINLSENQIGTEGAIAIAEALKENKSITSINLSDNGIGAEGARALAEALKENKSITSINLSQTRIGAEGARAIAEALKENKSITSINLFLNEIGAEGAITIAEALKENKIITSIDLSYNGIRTEGARAIAKALKENQSITSIDLSNNSIGDARAKEIAEALKENQSITSIYLTYNSIGDAGAKEIAEALKENQSITSIALTDNKIGADGVMAITYALQTNYAITKLKYTFPSKEEDKLSRLNDGIPDIYELLTRNRGILEESIRITHTQKFEDNLNIQQRISLFANIDRIEFEDIPLFLREKIHRFFSFQSLRFLKQMPYIFKKKGCFKDKKGNYDGIHRNIDNNILARIGSYLTASDIRNFNKATALGYFLRYIKRVTTEAYEGLSMLESISCKKHLSSAFYSLNTIKFIATALNNQLRFEDIIDNLPYLELAAQDVETENSSIPREKEYFEEDSNLEHVSRTMLLNQSEENTFTRQLSSKPNYQILIGTETAAAEEPKSNHMDVFYFQTKTTYDNSILNIPEVKELLFSAAAEGNDKLDGIFDLLQDQEVTTCLVDAVRERGAKETLKIFFEPVNTKTSENLLLENAKDISTPNSYTSSSSFYNDLLYGAVRYIPIVNMVVDSIYAAYIPTTDNLIKSLSSVSYTVAGLQENVFASSIVGGINSVYSITKGNYLEAVTNSIVSVLLPQLTSNSVIGEKADVFKAIVASAAIVGLANKAFNIISEYSSGKLEKLHKAQYEYIQDEFACIHEQFFGYQTNDYKNPILGEVI